MSGGPVTDLEVRRATLEDAYLSLIHRVESEDEPDQAGPARTSLTLVPAIRGPAGGWSTQEERR